MPRVKNKNTGFDHDVPDGHFSLTSDEYIVLHPKAEPDKAESTKTETKPARSKTTTKKK